MNKIPAILLLIIVLAEPAVGADADHKEIFPVKVSTSKTITIDGVLNEKIWRRPPLNKTFITTSPNFGQPLQQETHIWIAYDKRNLYFAFKCFDPEPHKIKTSIAQRDKISRDDQVGILLDASGARQIGYEFFVNPNGIQYDAVNSTVSQNGPDSSPDFVWESAGKITADGYRVEVRIPLESIRYQSGRDVKMRVMFVRRISRFGVRASWPRVEPGQTTFNYMATLAFKDLTTALKLEVLPNVVYSRNEERRTADDWDRVTDSNFGVGIKYGVSSAMTVEATVNPDFSQVESDAFQVQVNQRYPIFYSEKRPFFMENKEVLDFAVVKWGMMPAPIHTRRITDPGWAVKFSGSAGRMNFALLAANDRAPGRPWVTGLNPDEGKSALVGVFRGKYNIGGDSSIGLLYSGRQFAGQSNHAAGADMTYRFFKHFRASLSFLTSGARETDHGPLLKGNAWNAMLQYNTPDLFSMLGYERYDSNFRMDNAFLNRTGMDRYTIGAGPILNVKLKALPWLKRITPYAYYLALHDLETKMNDAAWLLGLSLGLAPMGTLNFEYYIEDEAWAGRRFHKKYLLGLGSIQLFKWLHLNGNITVGDAIYYHPETPFLGSGRTYGFGVTVQPDVKLNLGFNYTHTRLRRPGATGALTATDGLSDRDVYSVNIYNLRTTYQFNKYFFIRGILRYNTYQEKLLTDLLASFTLIPGTVVHLGYGSVYLKNRWAPDGQQWVPGQGDLMQMRRGLFFKASYLWRID